MAILSLGGSRTPHDDFLLGLVFHNHVGGENPAPVNVRVNHRAAPNDAAGIEHGVAPDVTAVADQCAELAQAGVEGLAVDFDGYISGHKLDVGDFHSGAEMRLVAEDGIADVIEVRRAGIVEQDGVFDFRRVAHHAPIAKDDLFAKIGVVADVTVAPDNGRSFDHDAVLQHRAFADKHLFTDEGPAFGTMVQRGAQICREVGLEFLQRVPGKFTTVKKRGVPGLLQVEKVARFEHASKLRKIMAAANVFLSQCSNLRKEALIDWLRVES